MHGGSRLYQEGVRVRGLRRGGLGAVAFAGAGGRPGQPGRPQGREGEGARGGAGLCSLLFLLFLPPYSPDFSPIEEAFSKIKVLLRKAEARTRVDLVGAIGRALSAVTDQDAKGFFGHCGYPLGAQPS